MISTIVRHNAAPPSTASRIDNGEIHVFIILPLVEADRFLHFHSDESARSKYNPKRFIQCLSALARGFISELAKLIKLAVQVSAFQDGMIKRISGTKLELQWGVSNELHFRWLHINIGCVSTNSSILCHATTMAAQKQI